MKEKMMKKKSPDLNLCVYKCMESGHWWTFWDLQSEIKRVTGKFFGEPTISAAIRNMRKMECRERFGLPLDMNVEVIERKRITGSRGYKYKLIKV